jgi:type III secretory pathway lipoprotein EscJ
MKNGYVKVLCTVFPSGEILWSEEAEKSKMVQMIDEWVSKNPKYIDGGCSLSTASIVMPKEILLKKQAETSTGSILWMPPSLH